MRQLEPLRFALSEQDKAPKTPAQPPRFKEEVTEAQRRRVTCPKSQCQLGLGEEPGMQTPWCSAPVGIKTSPTGGLHLRVEGGVRGGGEKCLWKQGGFHSLQPGWVSFRGHSRFRRRPVVEKKTGSGWGGTEDRIRGGGEVGGRGSPQEAVTFTRPESDTVSYSCHLEQTHDSSLHF